MLRQYGDRVLLFNMHCPETRKALKTAKETPNGYILVNEDISIDHIEAVYALEKTNWEFPFNPKAQPHLCEEQGINMAQAMCSYFSRCYHLKNSVKFEELEQSLQDSVTAAGQHYLQNLRHPGDAPTETDISAETPAQQRKTQQDKENLIDEMVQEIDSAVKAEVTQQQKIEPKLMPTTKKNPPDLPASASSEEPKQKIKPPPECAKVKPPPKHLAKSTSASTDTTVKVDKKDEAPPPPPPKKGTDTTVKPAQKEETSSTTTKRKNKMEAESGGPSTPPSTPSASSTRPHPIPPAPPARTPRQPDYPPPPKVPKQPGYPPPDHQKSSIPTPPAPPAKVLGAFWQNMKQSDKTDNREPLPRHRQQQQDDDPERPPFDLEYHANANMDAYVEVMEQISGTVPDSNDARQQRANVWQRIADLVEAGITTGSRMLDRMILQGRDTVQISQNVYHLPYVPTPAEHFMRQDPGEAGAIYRPSLMVKIPDEDFSWDVLDALGELGRNCLAGRAVLSDHPRHNSAEEHNVDTFYISLTVLNLGKIDRMPWFAGKKRYGSEIRDNFNRLKERLVLPHIVLNNPGHIITLCEAHDFSIFNSLCVDYGTIGIQCQSDKPDAAPPLAVFLKTPHGMLELLHHWDISKRTGSKSDGWLIHAAIVLCTFGPRSHTIDPVTRERREHRYHGEPINMYALVEEDRISTHGITIAETREDQLDRIETFRTIVDSEYYPVRGYPASYVQRMGLAEYRVLCVHINSYAFRHSLQRVREDLRSIFCKALMCMVDFICGDFNLFANRQFSRDTGGSIFGSVVLEVLEDAIRATNQQLKIQNRVTFNVSCSTTPQDVYDTVFAKRNSNMDCMLCISLFYNKQEFTTERPKMLMNEFSYSHDYLHSISERPRQLSVYDLCLGINDCDWHLPLVCRITAHAIKNKRTRGPEAQQQRNQRFRSWSSGKGGTEKGKGKGHQHHREEQQQWDDWHWYQDRGFQEHRYEHPTGRYYGDRRGPYPSHGSSSSSSRPQRWEGWYGGTR